MAKRGTVPKKFTIAVAAGTGTVRLDFGLSNLPAETIAGWLTHVVIEAPSGSPTGKVRIRSVDDSADVFKDPKPSDPNVLLDFYSYEMRVPVNGVYDLILDDVSTDGSYTAIITLEESPRSVL